MHIEGVKIVTPREILTGASLTIKLGKIQNIQGMPEHRKTARDFSADREEDWLIPGLIDTHVHGAGGVDAMDGNPSSMTVLARTLLSLGTTAFLATTMTADENSLQISLNAIKIFMELESDTDVSEAECLGIHLEGPFISRQYAGAHNPAFINEGSVELLNYCRQWSGGHIKIMTLAPEIFNAQALLDYCQQWGILPSAGHSAADWSTAQEIKAYGIHHVTHTFNAMCPLHHREPGLLGFALNDD